MNIQDVIAAQGQSMSIQQLQEMLAKAQAQQAPTAAPAAAPAPSIETVIAAATVQPTTTEVIDTTAKPEPQYNEAGVRLPGKKAPRTRRTKAELEAAALVEITPQKLLCACASGGVSPADAERYLAILEGLSD